MLTASVFYLDNQVFRCVSEYKHPLPSNKCLTAAWHTLHLRADTVSGEPSSCRGGSQLYPLSQSYSLKADPLREECDQYDSQQKWKGLWSVRDELGPGLKDIPLHGPWQAIPCEAIFAPKKLAWGTARSCIPAQKSAVSRVLAELVLKKWLPCPCGKKYTRLFIREI